MLRKKTAFHLLVASLLGVVVTMIHTLGVAGSTVEFSSSEIGMMILMPLLVAAFFGLVFEAG